MLRQALRERTSSGSVSPTSAHPDTGPPRTPEAPFPGMSDLSMELVYNPELELDPRMRARSLQQPRTLSGYREQLKMQSYDGCLEQRVMGTTGFEWVRRYCVLREGRFYCYEDDSSPLPLSPPSSSDQPTADTAMTGGSSSSSSNGSAGGPGDGTGTQAGGEIGTRGPNYLTLPLELTSSVRTLPSQPNVFCVLRGQKLRHSRSMLHSRPPYSGSSNAPASATASTPATPSPSPIASGSGPGLGADEAGDVYTGGEDELVFRASSEETFRQWLFCFHSSILSVIVRMMDQRHPNHQHVQQAQPIQSPNKASRATANPPPPSGGLTGESGESGAFGTFGTYGRSASGTYGTYGGPGQYSYQPQPQPQFIGIGTLPPPPSIATGSQSSQSGSSWSRHQRSAPHQLYQHQRPIHSNLQQQQQQSQSLQQQSLLSSSLPVSVPLPPRQQTASPQLGHAGDPFDDTFEEDTFSITDASMGPTGTLSFKPGVRSERLGSGDSEGGASEASSGGHSQGSKSPVLGSSKDGLFDLSLELDTEPDLQAALQEAQYNHAMSSSLGQSLGQGSPLQSFPIPSMPSLQQSLSDGVSGGPSPTSSSYTGSSSQSKRRFQGSRRASKEREDRAGRKAGGSAGRESRPKIVGWRSGKCCLCGNKDKNEDRATTIDDLPACLASAAATAAATAAAAAAANPPTGEQAQGAGAGGLPAGSSPVPKRALVDAFFGVYDGHAGDEAATMAADQLHFILNDLPPGPSSSVSSDSASASGASSASISGVGEDRLIDSVRRAFLEMDRQFLDLAEAKRFYSGTTAIVALLKRRYSSALDSPPDSPLDLNSKLASGNGTRNGAGAGNGTGSGGVGIAGKLEGKQREDVHGDEEGDSDSDSDGEREVIADLWVANLGDSAGFVCRRSGGQGGQGGQLRAVAVSEAQKPDRPDETERIEKAGGWITFERELPTDRLHNMDLDDPSIYAAAENAVQWVTISRVCGDLAVSRAIGDPEFKNMTTKTDADLCIFDFPADHSRTFSSDLLTADPEILRYGVTPQDDFLVLASDGIWDVLSGQQVVDKVENLRNSTKPDGVDPLTGADTGATRPLSLDEISEELCRFALRHGSTDNITAVIVTFDLREEE